MTDSTAYDQATPGFGNILSGAASYISDVAGKAKAAVTEAVINNPEARKQLPEMMQTKLAIRDEATKLQANPDVISLMKQAKADPQIAADLSKLTGLPMDKMDDQAAMEDSFGQKSKAELDKIHSQLVELNKNPAMIHMAAENPQYIGMAAEHPEILQKMKDHPALMNTLMEFSNAFGGFKKWGENAMGGLMEGLGSLMSGKGFGGLMEKLHLGDLGKMLSGVMGMIGKVFNQVTGGLGTSNSLEVQGNAGGGLFSQLQTATDSVVPINRYGLTGNAPGLLGVDAPKPREQAYSQAAPQSVPGPTPPGGAAPPGA